MLLSLRQNCFQLDTESIKLFRSQTLIILSLLLMPYMLQDISIFDLSSHSYQLHSIAISQDLRAFL